MFVNNSVLIETFSDGMLNFERQGPWILRTSMKAFGLLQHNGRKTVCTDSVAFPKHVPKFVIDDLNALIVKRVIVRLRGHAVPIQRIKQRHGRLDVTAARIRFGHCDGKASKFELGEIFIGRKVNNPVRTIFGIGRHCNLLKGPPRMPKPRFFIVEYLHDGLQISASFRRGPHSKQFFLA